METATIFQPRSIMRFLPGSAPVSDQPMVVDGVKTEASDKVVTTNFVGPAFEDWN